MGFGWMLMFLGLPFLAGAIDDEGATAAQTIDTDAVPGGLTSEPEILFDDISDDLSQVIAFEDTSMPHVHGAGCGHSQWDAAAEPVAADPVELDTLDPIADTAPAPSAMPDAQDTAGDWLNTNNVPHVCYGCHDCHVQVT